jgi:hypothetical protein
MKDERKPRADSVLDGEALTDAQREELRDMLLSGASHSACKAWLRTLGVPEIKGKDTLTRFWRRHCLPVRESNRKFSAVKAETLIEKAGRTDWNTATLELARQVSFEMLDGQALDPKMALKFLNVVLKADAQETDKSKAKAAAKDKAGAGIDALAEEAKGNPEAEAALAAYVKAMRKKKS